MLFQMRHRFSCDFLAGLLLFAAAGTAAGQVIEVPLTFEKLGEKDSGLRGWYQDHNEVQDGQVKPPSPGSYVTSFDLAGRTFYLAFEKANPADTFYSRMYFDANGNRDLTDDAVIESKEDPISEVFSILRFPPIDLEYTLQGQTLPYSVSVEMFRYLKRTDNRPTYNIKTAGFWSGTVDVGGNPYKISLGDMDCDGEFGAPIRRNPARSADLAFTGDRVCVNRPDAPIGPYDCLFISKHLFIGDRYYGFDVRTSERKIILTPMEMPPVALKLDPEIYQVQLVSTDFKTALCLFEPAGMVHIPAGTYHIASYVSSRTDEQGDKWALIAYSDYETAKLQAGGSDPAATTADLPVGPPYRALVVNEENQFKKIEVLNDDWRLLLSVKGRGDEFVGGIAHVEGQDTHYALSTNRPDSPAEPAWKIVSEDGEVAASGVFEYG